MACEVPPVEKTVFRSLFHQFDVGRADASSIDPGQHLLGSGSRNWHFAYLEMVKAGPIQYQRPHFVRIRNRIL
jgi:hypothetical protein